MLNHLVQRGKERPEGKIYAFFVDLRAAFDNVARDNYGTIMGQLWKILEKYEVNELLV